MGKISRREKRAAKGQNKFFKKSKAEKPAEKKKRFSLLRRLLSWLNRQRRRLFPKGWLVHFPARLRLWLKRAPIKKCFIRLTVINVVVTFLVLGIGITWFQEFTSSQIKPYLDYYDKDHTLLSMQEANKNPNIIYYSTFNGDTPGWLVTLDEWGNELILFLGIFAAIVSEATIFYNLKLKTPLHLLNNAAEKISSNDLDFTIYYGFPDEMGSLCASFEKMRAQLEENNKHLWRTMEDRKRLNAAFAHDLRTPITVLKGYTDFLSAYVPQGRVSEEKLLSTVEQMSASVSRLESYVNVMSSVQKLEDIEPVPAPVDTEKFLQAVQNGLGGMVRECDRELLLESALPASLCFDEKLVLRVLENLVSNALRYSESKIHLSLSCRGGILTLRVEDDGPGFGQTALHRGTDPFFRDKAAKGEHFGMGLNICKTLCEKHGGTLALQNGIQGGAVVLASFVCPPGA